MEYLNRCLSLLHENSDFKFHPRCKKLKLVHMCFADDLLLFSGGDANSIKQLFSVFRLFTSASGLKANLNKSSIYFGGVNMDTQNAILDEFQVAKGELPFRYLGVSLSYKKLVVIQFQPLLKKILDRINSWTARFLSYAGRVQLIKSVIFGIQTYWCQIFMIPKKVLKLIQAACRSFLWTGHVGASKRALVAWENICLPKSSGGFNIIDVAIWNQAAICKFLWNLSQKQDKLWIKWVHIYYVKQRNLITMKAPAQSSWIIRKIFNALGSFWSGNQGRDLLSSTNCSIKNLYKFLRGYAVKVPWKKMLCNNASPPKCIFIGWLAILGRLSTCDRLLKVGVSCDASCCFCSALETCEHLFFRCPFAAEIWAMVLKWLDMPTDNWSFCLQSIVCRFCSNGVKHQVFRMAIVVDVYMIWQERNLRKFQHNNNTTQKIFKAIQVIIYSRCFGSKNLQSFGASF